MCSDTPTTDHSWWFAGRWWLIDLCSRCHHNKLSLVAEKALPTLKWPLKAERRRWSELFCMRRYCKKRLISPQNKPLQQLSKQQTPIYIMPHLIIYFMKIPINNQNNSIAFELFCFSSRVLSPEVPPPWFKQKVKLDDLILSSVNIRSNAHCFYWVYSISLFLVGVYVTLLKFRHFNARHHCWVRITALKPQSGSATRTSVQVHLERFCFVFRFMSSV